MKHILVTQRISEDPKYLELRESLDVRWSRLLSDLGYLPVICSAYSNSRALLKNIRVDGILLTGGNDLGFYSKNEADQKRDSLELSLVDYGISRDIPIFGVCRGMQIIAHYYGSTLAKVDNHVAVRHEIHVNEQSRFASLLHKIKNPNSYHQYAVTNLGPGLRVSAKSSDHSIEAIEHQKLKIFGQMWHCERETPFVEAQTRLISYFFD